MIARIVLRNLRRHKLRALLGFLAVFLASLMCHLYIGASSALDDFFSGSLMRSTLLVKSRLGAMWIASLPNRVSGEVATMPGVVAATPLVNPLAIVSKSKEPVFMMGIDPVAFRVVAERDIAELAPEVYRRFETDPSAVLLARGVGLSHGLRVGSQLELPLVPNNVDRTIFPEYVAPPNPTLRGEIIGQFNRGVFSDRVLIVHHEVLERALQWDRAAAVLVRFAPNVDPGELAGRIEERFSGDGGVEVLILDSWFGGLHTFIKEISALVLSFIALIGLLAATILAHGVARAAYETLPELAVLRALGSDRLAITTLLAGEGLLVCVTGAGVATLIVGALTSMTTFVDLKVIDPSIAPVFELRASSILTVLGAAVGLAVLGAGVPAALLTRAPVALLLRRKE